MTRPTAPPIPDDLDRLLRRMRLPYLRKTAPDVLATARAQRWDPAEVLRVLINEEVVVKGDSPLIVYEKEAEVS